MEFKTHALFRDTHALFRDAVKQHAIKCGKVIKFLKSDRSKVRAVCKGSKKQGSDKSKGCPWLIYAAMWMQIMFSE